MADPRRRADRQRGEDSASFLDNLAALRRSRAGHAAMITSMTRMANSAPQMERVEDGRRESYEGYFGRQALIETVRTWPGTRLL